MAIKPVLEDTKSRLDALLTYANAKTGVDDANIGDAIKTLADGFGGGGMEIKSIVPNATAPTINIPCGTHRNVFLWRDGFDNLVTPDSPAGGNIIGALYANLDMYIRVSSTATEHGGGIALTGVRNYTGYVQVRSTASPYDGGITIGGPSASYAFEAGVTYKWISW